MMYLVTAGFAAAQITRRSTDVLGAHLNYGRGCSACHASHSGAAGNGNTESSDTGSGVQGLWGTNASGLYGKAIATGGGAYVEVLPGSMTATSPDVSGVLVCLSCHDGNFAKNSMMK